MTDTNNKIRSIVLAALMVFSVFAGTVALTGTAAAGTVDTANSSITPSTVNESTTNTHSVTLVADGVNTSGNGNQVFAVDLPDALDTSSTGVTNVNVNAGNVTYGGTYNVNTTSDVITVTLQDDSGVNSDTVNVTFDITNVAAPSVTGDVSAQAQFGLDENADGDYSDTNDDAFADFQQLTIVDTTEDADADVTLSNGSVVYQGQTVQSATGTFNNGEEVILRSGEPGDSSFENSFSANDNGVVDFDTSDLETGQDYFLEGQSSGEIVTFEVVSQSLSVSVDNTDIGNAGGSATTEASFSSNRQQFDVYVSADDLSADEIEMIVDDDRTATQVDLDDDGTNDSVQISVQRNTDYTLNASDIDAGDYTLEFDVVDTTASASSGFNVTDVSDGEAEFGQGSYQIEQGGIANISIDLSGAASGTEGTVVIGLEGEDGYQANVSFDDVNDDGEVNVMFNTYAAGSNSGDVVEAMGDDTATLDDQTSINNILAQGDYTLSVSTAGNAADTVDQPQDLGALVIGERSTDSMNLWTAPNNADLDADGEDGVTESDIASLIEDDVVTQDTTITSGDYVIHQVSATGLEGLVDSEGGLGDVIGNGVNLTLVQTNPVQNQDAKEINLTASAGALSYVEGDGAYYIVADTSNLQTESGRDIAAGDEFKATFTVTDDRLLRSTDADDHESVNATFEVEAPETTLDSDPVEVAASSGQNISGSTNLAPGTELTIRVRSTSDVTPGFFNTQTVTVQPDGTFSGEFDFSEQSAGDTFTVTVRNTNAEADGSVVESTSTETETTETVTETETTETVTETETTETDAPDTDTDAPDTETETEETSTDTPGFGVAVALVALLAAALLAGRRE